MKRLFVILLIMFFSVFAFAEYLDGDWTIDDYFFVQADTTQLNVGAATPSVLTYSIYEVDASDGSQDSMGIDDVDMLSPDTKLDGATGSYSAAIKLTAAAGFEVGKTYILQIKATVDGVDGTKTSFFKLKDSYAVVSTLDATAISNWNSKYNTYWSTCWDSTLHMEKIDLEYIGGVIYSSVLADTDDIWNKDISGFTGVGYAGTYLKTLYDDIIDGGRIDLILDGIASDLNLIDSATELRTWLYGSDVAGATASALSTASGYSLDAKTAAEKIDSAAELRTLLYGSSTPGATAAGQTAILEAIEDIEVTGGSGGDGTGDGLLD